MTASDRPGGNRGDTAPHDGDQRTEKLHKVLARAGVGSRRTCEDLIADGRVTVDGRVAQLGSRVDPHVAHLEVDGVGVGVRPDAVYYLLHKPAGVYSTAADEHGRTTVVDLVPAEPRVFPVGRLDAATEGLLILTNDGDLTYSLTHPKFGVDKEYLVHVKGRVNSGAIRRLREGVELTDGMTAPAKVSEPLPGVLRIVIHEGRNHQVRRMCAAVDLEVRRLVRVRIGTLVDHDLQPGEWRTLDPVEVRTLERAAAADPTGSRRQRRQMIREQAERSARAEQWSESMEGPMRGDA